KPRPFNKVLSDRTSAPIEDLFQSTPAGELTQPIQVTPQVSSAPTQVTPVEPIVKQVDSPAAPVSNSAQQPTQQNLAGKSNDPMSANTVPATSTNRLSTDVSSKQSASTPVKPGDKGELSSDELQNLINDIDRVDSLPMTSQSTQVMVDQTAPANAPAVSKEAQKPAATTVDTMPPFAMKSSATQGTASFDEDHSDIKIDLARMYLATGDVDNARSTLNAIIDEGESGKHYATAQKLLLQLY
ncbi:MAG: FimV/HubP family polar landmark protein, partial [Pseudomonadota bacterium]